VTWAFKHHLNTPYRKKVGGADRAVEYEKLLVQWIEEKFYQIQVLLPLYCAIYAAALPFLWKNSTSSKLKHFICIRGTEMNK
jgi:hypothetical protein